MLCEKADVIIVQLKREERVNVSISINNDL